MIRKTHALFLLITLTATVAKIANADTDTKAFGPTSSTAPISSITIHGPHPHPPHHPISLQGMWVGTYQCDDCTPSTVQWTATLEQRDNAITGAIIEAASFGGSSPYLMATLIGTLDPVRNEVQFRKTYNGVGGFTHTLWYSGHWDSVKREITGTYDDRAPFMMRPISY